MTAILWDKDGKEVARVPIELPLPEIVHHAVSEHFERNIFRLIHMQDTPVYGEVTVRQI